MLTWHLSRKSTRGWAWDTCSDRPTLNNFFSKPCWKLEVFVSAGSLWVSNPGWERWLQKCSCHSWTERQGDWQRRHVWQTCQIFNKNRNPWYCVLFWPCREQRLRYVTPEYKVWEDLFAFIYWTVLKGFPLTYIIIDCVYSCTWK